jgi:MFS family permease
LGALASDLDSGLAKIRRRLVPFLFLLYIVAYLDRINVGFASLQMNEALGFSDTVYALGAGVFFLSYVAFEIPSNVILARVGARIWIARIMISWGIVSSMTMFVSGAGGFYALRFLLGAAEAGFFPGIIYYLTQWIPAADRARTIAAFMTAVLAAGIVGGPVSGALLTLDGAAGLAGWQWLFLLEGLPSVALGLVVLAALADRPSDASWLTARERAAVEERLRADEAAVPAQVATTRGALVDPKLWLLAAVYFTIPVALYAIGFFLPQMIRSAQAGSATPLGPFGIGLASAIPYLVGAIGMVLAGRHSDRTGERRWHVAIAALGGGAAFAAAGFTGGLVPSIAALSIATLGLASMFGPFWSLATSFTRGIGAAAGIALINSVGNIGGFVGPSVVGYLRDLTSSFALGFVFIGAVLALGGLLVLAVRSPS